MVAVFGTMVADTLHIVLGVPYIASTVFFAVALAIIFVAWYVSEKTLSIHTINTRRRELFYWATVVTTFALGTAAGDMTATTLGLGYFASGVLFAALFAALFALPAVGYWLFGLNEVVAFWFAYIVTRPLGASFADWVGRPQSLHGLGLGTGQVSLAPGHRHSWADWLSDRYTRGLSRRPHRSLLRRMGEARHTSAGDGG